MNLDPHRDLIVNMPVQQHGFRSKREIWSNRVNPLPEDLVGIFDHEDIATISRADLFMAARDNNIARYIYKVLLWGYPRGMRGNNFESLVNGMEHIVDLLTQIMQNDNQISNWERHWKEFFCQGNDRGGIAGLKLSTYSKFLYFMGTRVNGGASLILDQALINVFSNGIFDEFEELIGINYITAPAFYPTYLSVIGSEAERLRVQADQLEMFLFIFGRILIDHA